MIEPNQASILIKVKENYLTWLTVSPHIPKNARYTLGARIDNKFLDLLDNAYLAYFSRKDIRKTRIESCLLILDTLKFLIAIAWEAKLISHRQYQDVSLKLGEVGKMFSGWQKYLIDEDTFARRRTANSYSSRPSTN